MTHYLPAFTEHNGRQQRAACGAWIFSSEHSTEPACLGCLTWLQADAKLAGELEATFAAPMDAKPVTYEPFDPIAGYRPKVR